MSVGCYIMIRVTLGTLYIILLKKIVDIKFISKYSTVKIMVFHKVVTEYIVLGLKKRPNSNTQLQ